MSVLVERGRKIESRRHNCDEIIPGVLVGAAMKREEILLRAYAKKISWIQVAEILGYSPRHLRRIRERYEELASDGLHDVFPMKITFADYRRV